MRTQWIKNRLAENGHFNTQECKNLFRQIKIKQVLICAGGLQLNCDTQFNQEV